MLKLIGLLTILALGFTSGIAWEGRPSIGYHLNLLIWHPGFSLPDGWKVQRDKALAELNAAKASAARHNQTAAAISRNAQAALTNERVQIQYRTKVLTNEVPVYVTPEADTRCVVPLGFVRLHDTAAEGRSPILPAAPGGPLDAPSGVPLSAVLATVLGNYGAAYDWRAEAMTWRDWYIKQRAEWEKR